MRVGSFGRRRGEGNKSWQADRRLNDGALGNEVQQGRCGSSNVEGLLLACVKKVNELGHIDCV